MMTFQDFLQSLHDEEERLNDEAFVNRNQELAGLKDSNLFNRYAIQLIVKTSEKQLLFEHEQYKQFKKTTDLYLKHPENPSIPVKAHYHVVDGKSKKEIYAVNMDGTAHHRQNKNFEVPKRQADELRQLGVQLPLNNILESRVLELNESLKQQSFSFLLILED